MAYKNQFWINSGIVKKGGQSNDGHFRSFDKMVHDVLKCCGINCCTGDFPTPPKPIYGVLHEIDSVEVTATNGLGLPETAFVISPADYSQAGVMLPVHVTTLERVMKPYVREVLLDGPVLASDDLIILRAAVSVTLDLPNQTASRSILYFKNRSLANKLTIVPFLGGAIDGLTSLVLNTTNDSAALMCLGNNEWLVI